MATLLPKGKQQFIDANGAPLASGSVYFYVPGTTSPKDTYQDSAGVILNTNPVVLDNRGEAVIYGAGSYRMVVKDKNGNLVWDQLTADTAATQGSFAGTSGGTANSQTVTASNFTSSAGQTITFFAGFTNTGNCTLNVNGVGALQIYRDSSTGPALLSGGELLLGAAVTVIYDVGLGAFRLFSPSLAFFTPVGTVISFAGASVPPGYLVANGAAIPRNIYAALYTIIGTSYGVGDGSTTFNIPDYRGEFLRGWDNGRGIDSGRVLGSFQADAFASHTHSASTGSAGAHAHNVPEQAGGNIGAAGRLLSGDSSAGTLTVPTDTQGAHSHSVSVSNTGGTETRPRNWSVQLLIKF